MKIEGVKINELSSKERKEVKNKINDTENTGATEVSDLPDKKIYLKKTEEEILLENTEITPENTEPMEGDDYEAGTNINFIVELEDGSRGFLKLFHPDRKVVNHPEPEKIERVNYIISHIMGFNLVPTTIIKDVHTKGLKHPKADEEGRSLSKIFGKVATGSFRKFIEDADQLSRVNEDDVPMEKIVELYIFYFITANWDGGDENILVKGAEVCATDTEGSLSDLDREAYNSLIENLNKVSGEKIPEKVKNILHHFKNNKQAREAVISEMKEVLTEEEIRAFFSRVNQITEVATTNETLTVEAILRLKIK